MAEYVKISDILSGKTSGKISMHGWASKIRDQKKIVFIILRDSTGTIQVACKDAAAEDARKATTESSVELTGIIKKDERAPGGYEIEAEKLRVIGLAQTPYPIGKDLSEEFIRDVRHLWVRSRQMTCMMKVQSEVITAAHDFYRKKNFTQFQSPILTTQACEGGSTLFQVKHPKLKVYLSQSWQLHAEAAMFALEKIYTVAPMFRAEKSRTTRHIAEVWLIEAESAWQGFEEMITEEEELILHIVKHVLTTCESELKELDRDTSDLKALKAPFKRLKYEEALKLFDKEWGYDFTDKDERELIVKLGNKPVFLTNFPREMKAFYMRPDPKDSKTVLGADLLVPGVGEAIGGAERIYDPKELKQSLKMFKLKEADYAWYLDLREYGTVPHSGYGMGLARLVMWITGAKHIMDTVGFPRTMDRMYP